MELNFIGRPGFSNFLTGKRKALKSDEYLDLEEKRFKLILKGIDKLKELEDEKLGISGLIGKQDGDYINFK